MTASAIDVGDYIRHAAEFAVKLRRRIEASETGASPVRPVIVAGAGEAAADVVVDGVHFRRVRFELPADFMSCGLDAFIDGYDPLAARGPARPDYLGFGELDEPGAEDEGDRLMRLIRDTAAG